MTFRARYGYCHSSGVRCFRCFRSENVEGRWHFLNVNDIIVINISLADLDYKATKFRFEASMAMKTLRDSCHGPHGKPLLY